MKFTKSLVAVAIAGIAAVPMMASATTTLSGVVEIKLAGDDTDTAGDFNNTKAGDAGIYANDVLMGVAAEQALNSGLTGYGSLRYDLNTTSGGGFDDADSVYVGVKGGFGDMRLGEVPNPGEYGQINDILTDVGTTINQGVSYVGSFGGATVGAAYSPAINQDVYGIGAKFAWQGLTIGAGFQNGRTVVSEGVADDPATLAIDESAPQVEDQRDNFSAKAGFSFAGASVELGFVSLGEVLANGDDETAIVAKVGYSISGVSLGLTYDAQQESEDARLRFDAGYDLGGGLTVSTRINAYTKGSGEVTTLDNPADDVTDWRIMLGKVF